MMNKHNCSPNSNYLYLKHQFDDFDVLATTVRAWDLDFRQLDRGQANASLNQIIGTNSVFSYARFNRHYHQQGSTPAGMRTFALLEEHVSGINWFGQEASTTSLMCFPTSRVLDAVTKQDFAVYTISFSEHLLQNIAILNRLPDLNEILSEQDNLAQCDTDSIKEIRRQLRAVHHLSQQDQNQLNNFTIAQILEFDLPLLILNTLTDLLSIPKVKLKQLKKRQALNIANEYIQAHRNEPILVNELCQHTNVSIRTLENAFKEYYDLTPKQYIRATRLNGVYKNLRDPALFETKITDIANKWGFWHMGQFAADYKNLFGELPSETRQQK